MTEQDPPSIAQVIAREMYEEYGRETGGKSAVTGARLPPWGEVGPVVQGAWTAAAVRAIELIRESRPVTVVFDGPPGPEPGRFVEVEDFSGAFVSVEWSQRTDGLWNLGPFYVRGR